MTDLKAAYDELRALLLSLGVEIESDTLDVWRDREAHGLAPLPATALRSLAGWADKRLADQP